MNEQSRFLIDFRLSAGESPPAILLYDHIGRDDTRRGTTSEEMATFLAENRRAAEVEVHINSTGGYAAEGIAMFNALRQFPGDVTTVNHCFALSAACLVFLAGDRRLVAPASHLMVHCASAEAAGNAEKIRRMARSLDDLDQSIAEMMAERVGQSMGSIKAMMDVETWLSAEEAVSKGFATGRTGRSPSMQATADLSGFRNIPPAVAQWRSAADMSNLIRFDGEAPRLPSTASAGRFAIL